MSPHDIIEIPWEPGQYARRVLVDALEAAGRPPINSAGRERLGAQLEAWNKYMNGTGSPADNPHRPDIYPLAHCRYVAADIDPTPQRVAALTAAGLRRPYSYEPWHWEVPNVYDFELVDRLPAPAAGGVRPFHPPITEQEYDMKPLYVRTSEAASVWMINPITGKRREVTTAEWEAAKRLGAHKTIATVTPEQLSKVQVG